MRPPGGTYLPSEIFWSKTHRPIIVILSIKEREFLFF